MILSKIVLSNYKSIDDETEINFSKLEKKCLFLFGINEAGKTNILKGCRMLNDAHFKEFEWSKDCFRENKREELDSLFDYFFVLEKEEQLGSADPF